MSAAESLDLTPERREEWRERARNDLWWLNQALGHGAIPMTERTHYSMIRFAERKTGIPEIDDARVQMLLVPREYGKSTCITKTRTIQHILRDPNHTCGIGNESLLLAKGFLGEIKQVFENNDLIKALFPEIIPQDFHKTRWAADMIDVERSIKRKEPTILAAGVDRAITGMHMGEWVLDDILSDEAAENARRGSFTEIEKIKRWMNRLEPLCDGPDTPITIIGTPWWEGDCYDYAIELWGDPQREQTFTWILRLPDGTQQHIKLVRSGDLAIYRRRVLEDGELTFPEMWPMKRVQQVQRSDPQLFAANLMLEPSSEIIRDLKDAWLRYYTWEPYSKQVRFIDDDGQLHYALTSEMDVLMSIDPAIAEDIRADRTGIIVSGTLDGKQHFILEALARRMGVSEILVTIAELAKRHKPRRIFVESVAYQRALAQILRRDHPTLPIEEYKPGNQRSKEIRIRALEPYFRSRRIYLSHDHIELKHEYAAFPRGRHDDLLDALAQLTDAWGRYAGGGSSSIVEQRRKADEKRISQLRRYSQGLRGRRSSFERK